MPFRYLLVVLTFFLSLLLYFDRACISVAKSEIMGDLQLDDKQFGWVLAIFTLGYALAQTPSGKLADKAGPRLLLGGVVAFWSVMTAITGVVGNYMSMLLARFVFGASEAGAFPGLARASLSWYPLKERGLVTGINFSASRLGASLAMPLMVWLIAAAGWRNAFYILGGIGVAFAIFWYIAFRNEPKDHPLVSDAEEAHIAATRQQVDGKNSTTLTFGEIIKSQNCRLAMLQYFCSNFTFFFCLSWLFPHVKETYGLTAASAGLLASLPLLGGALGNWVSGFLVDRLYVSRGLVISRRVPAICGFALAAIGLVASLHMSTAAGAIAFLTLAVFGADMTLSPSWSFCVDVGGKSSGAVSGTMNMAGNLGSFATTLAFPYLKATFNSTEPFFYIGAALNVVAIIVWLRMRPDRPISGQAAGPSEQDRDS